METSQGEVKQMDFCNQQGKSAQKKFWITAWSVVNILSPEKRLDCGIDTVGPDHPVNGALEVCNTQRVKFKMAGCLQFSESL